MTAAPLPPGTPEIGTTGCVADVFGVTPAAVKHRITRGDLPAVAVPSGGGRVTYVVRLMDAALLWGDRLTRSTGAMAS